MLAASFHRAHFANLWRARASIILTYLCVGTFTFGVKNVRKTQTNGRNSLIFQKLTAKCITIDGRFVKSSVNFLSCLFFGYCGQLNARKLAL